MQVDKCFETVGEMHLRILSFDPFFPQPGNGAKHSSRSWSPLPPKGPKRHFHRARCENAPSNLFFCPFFSTARKSDKNLFKTYLEESCVLVSALGDLRGPLSKPVFCVHFRLFCTFSSKSPKIAGNGPKRDPQCVSCISCGAERPNYRPNWCSGG